MSRLLAVVLFACSCFAQTVVPILGSPTSAGAGTAPAFVQAKNCQANSATSCSTASFAVTGGNTLVVGCVDTLHTSNTISASDGTNTFTQIGTNGTYASQGVMAMLYAKNITGGTRAVSCNATTAGNLRMVVFEITNVSTTAPLDSFSGNTAPAFNNNGGVTSGVTAAFTTTVGSEILVAFAANATGSATYSAGTGYTIPTNGTVAQAGMEYKVVGSIQTGVTAGITMSSSDGLGMMAAGFHN